MVWISKLRERLALETGYLAALGSHGSEFLEEITTANTRHLRPSAILTIGLCVVGYMIHSPPSVLYLVGMGAGLGFTFIPRRWGRSHMVVFLTWITVVAAYLDATDPVSFPAVVDLLGIWTVSAGLVTFRPLAAVFYFGAGAVGAAALVWVTGGGLAAWGRSYLPIATSAVIGYSVSRIVFALKFKSFQARKLVEDQGKEITLARRLNQRLSFAIHHGLTPREQEVLGPLIEGASNQSIADSLFISLDTVKKHVYHIFQKSGVDSRIQLIRRIEARSAPFENPTIA